jgi:hypothetical protein
LHCPEAVGHYRQLRVAMTRLRTSAKSTVLNPEECPVPGAIGLCSANCGQLGYTEVIAYYLPFAM